jgi:hypothetical protein
MFPLVYFEDRRGNLWFKPEEMSDEVFDKIATAISEVADDCDFIACDEWMVDMKNVVARLWTADQHRAFVARDKRLALRKKRK